MPGERISVNGTALFVSQSGPDAATPILFSHGLLFDHRMFDHQAEALQDRYRVVRYDHRGQGLSDPSVDKSIAIETLYDDAVGLIETLGLAPCHMVGLSMGGFVAQRIAARRPDLLRSVVLLETSPDSEDHARDYRRLNLVARWLGVRPVVGKVMPTMFGETFLNDPSLAEERDYWREHLTGLDRSIVRAVAGVIDREGCLDELGGIGLPTLVMVGDEDVATPPEKAQRIHEAIAGSELEIIPGAGHTSTIEQPDLVTAAIEEFLARVDASG